MTWSGNYYYNFSISLIHCKVLLSGLILAITFLDAKDTITGGIDSIKDVKNETLISAGNRFQLGFFSLNDGDSGYSRYVGIWYYMLNPRTIVWVANRNSSLRESTGVFTIADNGNLVVMDRTGNSSYFSSSGGPENSPSGKERKIQLLDSGNLVLSDHDGNTLWQSFDHPTDTFLPGMKMNQMLKLVSWKSLTDPFPGKFSFEMEEQNILVIKKKRTVDYYWKSGESDLGNSFDNPDNTIPSFVTFLLLNISHTSTTRNKSKLQPVANIKNNSRLWMSPNGKLEYLMWDNGVWNSIWSAPEDVCSVYNVCGAFGNCSISSENGTAVCNCLRGFKPKSVNDWNSGYFSSGCERNTTTCSTNYTFLELTMVKVGNPNSPFEEGDENKTECERACLENCQCLACSFKEISRRGSPKCWIWTSDLKNLQEHVEGAVNVSIRVAVADLGDQDT